MSVPSRLEQAHLASWYFATVGAIALYPFLAVHLTGLGLSDAAATATLALLPLGSLIAGPWWTVVVDRGRGTRAPLTLALAFTTVCVASLLLPLPAAAAMVVIGVLAVSKAPVFPLADALTVERLGDRYGVVRAVGSMGYVLTVLLSGWQREAFPWWPIAAPAVLLLGATLLTPTLPAGRAPSNRQHTTGELRALWRTPGIPGLLLVVFLNGVSLTTYDHLFTLHMERLGVANGIAGAAIAWGVLVEVGILFAGPFLLRRLGSARLLVGACAVGVPRYLLTAWLEDPIAIGMVQGLHGVQFGAFWLAAVDRMALLAPSDLKRSAQSLIPATGFGLATLISLAGSALWLLAGTTRPLFLAMAVPAALATITALFVMGTPKRR